MFRSLPWAVIATILLLAGLVLRLRQVALAWHLYVAVLGLLGAVTLIGTLLNGTITADRGRRLRLPWRRRRRWVSSRIRSLQELEHAADFSLSTAFDVHYRLRPHLRRIAEHRLANRGVRLDADPERSRRLLGPLAWDLLRPGREPPDDRNAPGLSLAELRALVDVLEAV
jgi:hypothetical protein